MRYKLIIGNGRTQKAISYSSNAQGTGNVLKEFLGKHGRGIRRVYSIELDRT